MNLARVLSGLRSASRISELPRARAATQDWIRLAAAYTGVSKLRYPYRIALRDGAVITIETCTDLATFWLIFFSKTYLVYDTDLRIIDAGANVGMFTTYAASKLSQS